MSASPAVASPDATAWPARSARASAPSAAVPPTAPSVRAASGGWPFALTATGPTPATSTGSGGRTTELVRQRVPSIHRVLPRPSIAGPAGARPAREVAHETAHERARSDRTASARSSAAWLRTAHVEVVGGTVSRTPSASTPACARLAFRRHLSDQARDASRSATSQASTLARAPSPTSSAKLAATGGVGSLPTDTTTCSAPLAATHLAPGCPARRCPR